MTADNPTQRPWLRPCTLIWLILMALTLVAFGVGKLELTGTTVVALILASTFIKAQLVADYFMGLKFARPVWRIIMTSWIVIVCAGIGLAWSW
jgi:cytochrome c oxidase subunit IV